MGVSKSLKNRYIKVASILVCWVCSLSRAEDQFSNHHLSHNLKSDLFRVNLETMKSLLLSALSVIIASTYAGDPRGTKIGDVPAERIIPFQIGVPVPNQAELDQFLEDLYNSSSPNYLNYLESEEFYARFSPKDVHISVVQSFLDVSNLELVSISKNKFIMEVRGQVQHINKAFKCNMEYYRHNKEGYIYRAPHVPPLIPDGAVAVVGLDNSTMYKRNPKQTNLIKRRVLMGANVNSNLFPLGAQAITTAYGIPTQLTGTGQNLGLVEYDNFLDSDITSYANLFSLPTPNFIRIPVDPTCELSCNNQVCVNQTCVAPPSTPGKDSIEVTLDIQVAMAVAPAANIRVYIGANSLTVSVFNLIAQDNVAKVISTSWGFPEDAIFNGAAGFALLENQILQQMAAQGQSFFAAAGDNGAFGDPNNPTALVIQDPSSQPFITAVGGTHLTLDSNGVRTSETTWNDGTNTNGVFEGGGGGISVFWPLPNYQAGVANSANLGSTTFRNVPDVSLNADPVTGYIIVLNGNEVQVGGTSAAAPIWAGFMTLVNQVRSQQNKSPMGFLNPTFYSLFKSSQYSQLMNDINDLSTNGHFPAVTGYDLATGWGSFIPQNLLSSLVALGSTSVQTVTSQPTSSATPPTVSQQGPGNPFPPTVSTTAVTQTPTTGNAEGKLSTANIITIGAAVGGSVLGFAGLSIATLYFRRRKRNTPPIMANNYNNNIASNSRTAQMQMAQSTYPGQMQMSAQNPMFRQPPNVNFHQGNFFNGQQYPMPSGNINRKGGF